MKARVGAQYGLGRDGARGLADGTHTTHRFPVRLASRRTLCRKKKRGRKRCSVLVSAVAALLAAGIVTGIRYDIALFLFAFGAAYVASGPLLMLGDFRKSKRMAGHGYEVHIDEED